MKNQKMLGVIFSYISSIIQIILSFLFTPYLITTLGKTEYGLYQMVSSFAATLAILNFGVAIIMSRNITRYRIQKDKEGLENALSTGLILTVILFFIIVIVGSSLSLFLEPLYGNSLSSSEMTKARSMFFILIFHVGIIVWQSLFSGISIGFEKFGFTNIMKILSQLLRVLLIIILLNIGYDALAIVIADVSVALTVLLIEFWYNFKFLKIRFKWHYYDSVLWKTTLTFGVASLIQSIIRQVNLSLDKVIIGSLMTPDDVTVYSVAILLLTAMITLTKIFASVYLPEATKVVLSNGDSDALTNLVIKPGRFQAIVAMGIVFGFIALGKPFLHLWLGNEYKVIWLPTLVILIPASLSNITTVADTILDAKLKKMARSIILFITACVNIVFTLIMVPKLGFMGAAIGTSLSYIIGNLLILNTYYSKKIGIKMIYAYQCILKGILPSALLSTIPVILLSYYFDYENLAGFIFGCLMYILTYSVVLFFKGLNKKEKKLIIGKLKTFNS